MEKQKQCFVCKNIKKLTEFYKHPDMPDGTVNKCKECNKKENKENWWLKREEKRAYDMYRHRYSVNRIFSHRFNGIKERCEKGGTNGRKYKVTGSKYISKQEFINWCYKEENYKKFICLYTNWVNSNFDEKLSPSIDRIDNEKSYILSNIQWLSKSENCKKYNK